MHRGRASEDVRSLAHEPRGVDFGAGGDDFGFSDALLLGGGGEGGGDFGGEYDIFDAGERSGSVSQLQMKMMQTGSQHAQDTLNRYTPLVRNVTHNLGNLECNRLALGNDALNGTCTHNMPERRLRTLNKCLAEVCDAERSTVRTRDLEVDDRVAKKLIFSSLCKANS